MIEVATFLLTFVLRSLKTATPITSETVIQKLCIPRGIPRSNILYSAIHGVLSSHSSHPGKHGRH